MIGHTNSDGNTSSVKFHSILEEALYSSESRKYLDLWDLSNIGNRPLDYAVRDLLLGSVCRDPRITWISSCFPISKEDELSETLRSFITNIHEKYQTQAAQLTILRLLHLYGLSEVESCSDKEFLIDSLRSCRPMGGCFKRKWNVISDQMNFVCKQAHLCPWCLARDTLKLYNKIYSLLTHNPYEDIQQIVVAQVSYLPEYLYRSEFVHGSQRLGPGWYEENSLPDPTLFYRSLNKYLHGLGVDLAKEALRLGIRGGVVIHQSSPWIYEGESSFRHEITFLGEYISDKKSWLDFQNTVGLLSCTGEEERHGLVLAKPKDLKVTNSYFPDHIRWCTMPACSHSLRMLLFGSSESWFDHKSVDFKYCDGDMFGKEYLHGLTGAVSLPPLFLLNKDQWWSYREATYKMPLYTFFGEWTSRKYESEGFLEKGLLNYVKSIWPEVVRETKNNIKGRGRPSYKRALKERLEQEGIECSTWQLQWIMTQLDKDLK